MHVISREPFEKATRDFPNDADAIIATYKQLKEKDFTSPAMLREYFPSLDNFKYRDKWWVIDIGGHNLRMIAYINFLNKRLYVKHIATHREYDKLTKYYRETKE
ncbi:type II toxin-antitoxin system HigB family toxin [Rouxiella sp. Mn2063]|uniref:type II toxin-antitoxin system HigB family toxin n=1 Tax=Rouxiella sp. Mn2063 TaxID=3395262 RepID=UPI003BE25677